MATDATWTTEQELRRDPGFPIFVGRTSDTDLPDEPRILLAEFGIGYSLSKTDFRESRWRTLVPEMLGEVSRRRSAEWDCPVGWVGAHLQHTHYEMVAVLGVGLPASRALPTAPRIRFNVPEELWIRFRDLGERSASTEVQHWFQHAAGHTDVGEQHKGVHKLLTLASRAKSLEALCPSTGYRRLVELLVGTDPLAWILAAETLRTGYPGQTSRSRQRWRLAEELSTNIKDSAALLSAVDEVTRRHRPR